MTMMKHLKKVMMALLLAAGMTGSVNGALLYYDVADVDIDDPAAYTYNPLTGTGAFEFGAFGIIIVPGDYGFSGSGGWQVLASSGSSLALLDGTETIDATSGNWISNGGFFAMPVGDTNYFGIRYDAGSGYGYGWVQIQKDVDRDAILLASAFNEGAPITAGQTSGGGGGEGGSAVPEPGTAVMLSIGVAILSASRRRFRREG
jgi:hypothetical protein